LRSEARDLGLQLGCAKGGIQLLQPMSAALQKIHCRTHSQYGFPQNGMFLLRVLFNIAQVSRIRDVARVCSSAHLLFLVHDIMMTGAGKACLHIQISGLSQVVWNISPLVRKIED